MDKLIFLNVSSMSKYEGMKGDTMSGAAKQIKRHGWGHEMMNF